MWIKPSLAIFPLLVTAIAGCTTAGKKDISAEADNQILSFDEAMESLVKGLNKLSDKEKNFGMLVDQINVKFTLAKTDKNEFGINLKATSDVTSATKFESFNVEKGTNVGTDTKSSSLELFNSLVNEDDTGKSENKSTEKSSSGSTSSSTQDSTNTNNATTSVTGKTGAEVSANYSSVQTGSGENIITIQFKSLATYPKDKTQALARLGMLGCLPFYIDVLGTKISDPKAIEAAMAAVRKISDNDDACWMVEKGIITETDRATLDTSEPVPLDTEVKKKVQ